MAVSLATTWIIIKKHAKFSKSDDSLAMGAKKLYEPISPGIGGDLFS
jgi:hypothetical protein